MCSLQRNYDVIRNWERFETGPLTVHNGCIVEGYIDFVPENLFSCMISKFLIVISKDVLRF